VRIVAALGGNAILRRGEPLTTARQRDNLSLAARALAALADAGEIVVTHGNGPQVGLLALQAAAAEDGRPTPLDVLDAESEGMIGYELELALRNALPGRSVATLLTQVVVSLDDPAFTRPTKPIGPVYGAEHARELASAHGWDIAPDGDGLRRVVPSPEPLRIVELHAVEALLAAGCIVVCAGGGGIPVAETGGRLEGVEAVIDKDLASALLAEQVAADRLLLITDVAGVLLGFGGPAPRLVRETSPDELRRLSLAPGSMGPKAEAACRFVERTGGTAVIGPLEGCGGMIDGSVGTIVRRTGIPSLRMPR